jgi:hypothetical protein
MEIMDTYYLLQEMEQVILTVPAPMSSGLLEGLSAQDRKNVLRSYLDNLDNLITASIFAAFESQLRDHVSRQFMPSSSSVPLNLASWLEESIERVRISELLDAYSGVISKAQKIRVDNIRRFRNWVAHSSQKPLPSDVKPETPLGAYPYLQGILKAIGAL